MKKMIKNHFLLPTLNTLVDCNNILAITLKDNPTKKINPKFTS